MAAPTIPDISAHEDYADQSFLIAHQDPSDVVPVDVEVGDVSDQTFSLVEDSTCRGKPQLVLSQNHIFNKKRTLKSGHIVWQCSIQNKSTYCSAVVKQLGDVFEHGPKPHVCVPKASALAGAKVRAQINIQGKSDVISSAANVVQLALGAHLPRNAPTEALPQPSSLARKCNRLRHDSRPHNPETLDFDMDDSALPENFLRADIKVGNRRHLVFYNDQLLDLLKAAKEWYVDGTLKSVGAPFVQLWSIHLFISHGDSVKQVPVLYSLMSGKSTEDYKVILEHISQSNALEIQSVVMDFENATWNAFRDIFPEADRKGCHFHWTQALWRKVQALGLVVANKHQRPSAEMYTPAHVFALLAACTHQTYLCEHARTRGACSIDPSKQTMTVKDGIDV